MQHGSALPLEDPIQEDTDPQERLLVCSELQTWTTRSSHQQPLILLNRQKFLIKWGKSHNHSHEENAKGSLAKSWPLTSFTDTGRSRICLEKKNFACLFKGVAWWSCSSKITKARLPGEANIAYKCPIEIWDLSKRSALHCCLPFLIHSAAQLKTSGRSRGGNLSLLCIFKSDLLGDNVLFY